MDTQLGDILVKATRTNRLGSIEGAICFNASPDYVDVVIYQEKMKNRTPGN